MHNDIFSIQNKWALITGASRGIGAALALGLAEHGANLVLTATNYKSLETIQKQVEKLGQKAIIKICDFSNETILYQFIDEIKPLDLPIEILINNAGIIHRDKAETYSNEQWDRVMNINLRCTKILCQEFGKEMIRLGHGKIINMASVLSFTGGTNVCAYSASKAAIVAYTKALANEWANKNINVNAVAPGYIKTDLTQQIQKKESIMNRIPAGKWGIPEDIIGAIVFLASKASDYVHGHTLIVDGGWSSC